MPFFSGITMSMVVRSGPSARYFSTASLPLPASPTTSKPLSTKMLRSIVRMKRASSTISTLAVIVAPALLAASPLPA